MKHIYLAIIFAASLNGILLTSVSANPTYKVDNTAENVRDRNGENVTPQDQSNRKSAIKTTATLRKEIMRTRGLSQNAQNIKIIDRSGCITLRGPVDSEQEKTIIDDLARQCCGTKVKNELEVKVK